VTTAADLFVKCLETEGVDYVFGLPGEETLGLMDALSRSTIQFVSARHEQGAAFMADVYGRLTGRPGVCLSTLGPGATNLITGVADAFLDRAPVVAISGQVGTEKIHKESHQYVDLGDIFAPVTKWHASIGSPDVIPEIIRKAFRLAMYEKPGAVHIELPENIAGLPASGEPLRVDPIEYADPPTAAIRRAAHMIAAAERPIILAGNGVIRRNASKELAALARRLGVPVANTFMGKGILDYSDELALLTVGLQNRDLELAGLDAADVVIAIGYDMVEYAPRVWNPRRDKRVIHIDTLPSEVDQYYQPEVDIVSEIPSALDALAAASRPRSPAQIDGRGLRDLVFGELERYRSDTAVPLKPQRIIAAMQAVLAPDDIVISDVGAHKLWISRMYPARRPNTVIISNGFASMGIGLPGAIAAKLVHPDRTVVTVSGDGGFLMNVQELETARRIGAAIVCIVWVDGGYGLIEWKESGQFGHAFGTSFGNPDFLKLADAFGIPGFQVTDGAEIESVLRAAIATGEPSIVAVPVDYRENLTLKQKLGDVTPGLER